MTSPTPKNPGTGGVPTPPPVIPKPDIKDIRESGPTYGAASDDPKGKMKVKKERSHPTDPYEPLPNRRGCFGCGGCLAVIALLFVLFIASIVGAYFWMGPGRFVSRGYTVVNLRDPEATVETAPDNPTVFIAPGSVHYRVPVTRVPVAIYAKEILIEGDFHDDVSLNAVKVRATVKARFAKNLEVHAAEFTDEGLTLKGDLAGKVIRNHP